MDVDVLYPATNIKLLSVLKLYPIESYNGYMLSYVSVPIIEDDLS